MYRFAIVLLTLSLILLSCSDDTNPSEPTAEHFTITINELPDTIRAIVGTTQEASFYVDLKRDDGTVVEDETIRFMDATEFGQVTPEEVVTNEVGEAVVTYSVGMPEEETTSRILVEANNRTTTANVTLIPLSRPWAISVEVDTSVLIGDLDTPVETQINAFVIDSTGLVVPGVNIAFSIDTEENTEVLGSVIPSAITDSTGRATSTFRCYNQYGTATIIARVEEPGFEEKIQGSVDIFVFPRSIATITISMSRSFLTLSQVAPRDTVYSIGITAVVQDSDGQIVRDAPSIQFSTTHGRIIDGELHFNPAIDMDNDGAFRISITGYIPGYEAEGGAGIWVRVLNDLPILTLNADRYAIQADGAGGCQANLSATLATPEGMPIPGKEIRFIATENTCIIQSPVLTDSMGITSALFDDIGRSGLVSVYAESEYGNSDSIEINIQEHWIDVASIDLFVENTTYDSNQIDSTKVRAVCYLENGLPVPGGNSVYFEAQHGFISSRRVMIDDRNGSAETYYKPRNAGVDSIYATVMNLHDIVQSNIVVVNILSGPPAHLSLRADPEEVNINDPNAISLISATVTDENGYPVRSGTQVNFEATQGHLGGISYTIETGEAFVFFYPGFESGEVVLTASVESESGLITGQTIITMNPGNPNSIELSCEPLFSHVRGTCGCGGATLRATVRDANENLVLKPTPVVFELINEPDPPAGCTIGNEFDQNYLVYTNMGIAITTINPGTQIGGKLIRAYTWRDSAARPDDIITNTFSSFAIISGPPFQLDISVDNDGEDAGGGAWALEVSARVWDIHRNPVRDRIPVVFTVEPEIANISVGWTGNENSNGESVPGLAFGTLVYNSGNSLQELEIIGEVQTERGQIQGSWEFILPVQDGVLTLEEPNGDFLFEDEDGIIEAQFTARLIDGHQIRIEDAPFVFTSDLGDFDLEQPGLWRASQEDIFFDEDVHEQVVTFRVRVEGTDIVSEPLEIIVRRR